MPNNISISKQNLDALRASLDRIADRQVGILNEWLSLGELSVKRNIDSGEWVAALKRDGGCPAHLSFKSVQNNIMSAANLIRHFGSLSKAEAAIEKHNAGAKRASYNPQNLEQVLIKGTPAPKPAPKPSGKPSLDAAVKAGVITKQQAQALKKMGF